MGLGVDATHFTPFHSLIKVKMLILTALLELIYSSSTADSHGRTDMADDAVA